MKKFILIIAAIVATGAALGQTQPPPDPWSGSFGAGFSLTGGNTDTTNFSLSANGVYDPKTRNLLKLDALYLRADQNEQKTADRFRFSLRDEYKLNDRAFVFGDFTYLRDPFKEISYLVNPYGGLGYKAIATDTVMLSIDGGAGVAWEKNPAFETDSSGTVNAGQALEVKLSEGASLIQKIAALWKMQDFEDALYHFDIGVSTKLSSRMELKVQFIDDFKNVTPSPEVKKNDTAFLTSFLFSF